MIEEVDYNNRSNSEVVDGQAREEAIVEVKMVILVKQVKLQMRYVED